MCYDSNIKNQEEMKTMSTHIQAKPGEIAQTILLPGDPMRAKFIAEQYLEDAKCYNEVRGMYGYTGYFQGHRISVQGTGMGIPSMGIYSYELIHDYGVKNLLRIGTCGVYQKDLQLFDVILAQGACTDSHYPDQFGVPGTFAPIADFTLLYKAYQTALRRGQHVHVGNVVSSDVFYDEDSTVPEKWARMGVLAVEMEAAGLYANAARYGARALAILTVSDSFATGEETTALQREQGLHEMIGLALETAVIL